MKKRICVTFAFVLIVCCAAIFLGGCGEKAPGKVNADSINYDGTAFTWTAVSGASGYLVNIDSMGESEVPSSKRSYTAAKSKGEVTVSIKSKNSKGVSEAVTKTFTRLATIDAADLRFNEKGEMSWDDVEEAYGYIISVNGKEKAVDATSYNEFERGGDNEIKVRATGGNGTFSQYGTAVVKTYLAAPDDILYDNDEGVLKWAVNRAAESFDVYIDGNLYAEGVSGNSFKYSSDGKSFDVAVMANGDGTKSFSSPVSNTVKYTVLDAVRNIGVTDGKISWDAVDEATGYEVSKDGKITKVTECRADIDSGRAVSVKIRPIAEGNNFFAVWSETKNITVLAAPNLKWDSTGSGSGTETNSFLHWDMINNPGVGGYKVWTSFNDDPTGTVTTYNDPAHTFYSNAYSSTGTYTVKVASLAASGYDCYDSVWSAPLSVERLPAPKTDGYEYITSNENDLSKGFTVKIKSVTGAAGYQIGAGDKWGVTQNKLNLTVSGEDIVNEGEYGGKTVSYKIRTMAGKPTTVGGTTYVKMDSIETLSFDIRVLATPSNPDFAEYDFTWSPVADAHSGRYAIKFNDVVETTVTGTSFGTRYKTAGDYYVSVCALGDGGAVLPSAYSNALHLKKLDYPRDVHFNTNVEDGTLEFGKIAHAKGYKVVTGQGGEITELDPEYTSITAANQFIKTDTAYLRVYSVANYWDDENNKTVYYGSSCLPEVAQQFRKLAAPTWGTPVFKGTVLQWNRPDNIGEGESVRYAIYANNNIAYTGEFTVNEYDIANFEADTYEFKIKAIGNGSKYVNSEMSATVSVTKLKTPQLVRESGGTAYTWVGVADVSRNYLIKIGSAEYEVANLGIGKIHSFTPEFQTVSDYQISLIAVGDGNTTMNSKPYELTQKVKKLGAINNGDFTVRYSDTTVSANGKIIIDVVNELEGARAYDFRLNGLAPSSSQTDGTHCEINRGTAGECEITVIGKGGYFDAEGNYIKDGDPSRHNTLSLLTRPSSISVNMEGTIEWQPSARAPYGYKVTVEYDDGTTETVDASSTRLTADNYNSARKTVIKIEVSTKGNGSNVIESQTTVWTN